MKKKNKKKMTEKWFDAVKDNNIKTVQRMIEKGFDVNIRDRHGWTALHFACIYLCDLDMMKLLLDNGAGVNIQNQYARTSFHYACYQGYIEIAKLLISRGADITLMDEDKDLPLDDLKEKHPKKYQELTEWLSENHPEKMLEYMANENIQSKGTGL